MKSPTLTLSLTTLWSKLWHILFSISPPFRLQRLSVNKRHSWSFSWIDAGRRACEYWYFKLKWILSILIERSQGFSSWLYFPTLLPRRSRSSQRRGVGILLSIAPWIKILEIYFETRLEGEKSIICFLSLSVHLGLQAECVSVSRSPFLSSQTCTYGPAHQSLCACTHINVMQWPARKLI